MPGGWTMSAMWMPSCGQGWADVFACFIAMWSAMMAVMMLPSMVLLVWRYVQAMKPASDARIAVRAAFFIVGYFAVWVAQGAVVFALVAALAEAAMQVNAIAHSAPLLLAMTVLLASAYQFTPRKARHLACCRMTVSAATPKQCNAFDALQHGAQLGLQCSAACAGITAILLVLGMMDWRVMTVATIAITAERLAPKGERVAWAIGTLSFVTGVYLMTHAA